MSEKFYDLTRKGNLLSIHKRLDNFSRHCSPLLSEITLIILISPTLVHVIRQKRNPTFTFPPRFPRAPTVRPVFCGAQGNFAPHQSAGGTKYKLFFWHVPHFIYADQRRYLRDLSTKRRGVAHHSGHASRTNPATALQPLTTPSSLIATLTQPPRDRGERQSGSDVGRGTEYRSVARGTRNIRFRNELTLRPLDNPPPCVCMYVCTYVGSLRAMEIGN